MTRAELRARVRFFLDEPQQQNFTDADINIALNIAQGIVQLEVVEANEDYFINPTPITVPLIAGTEAYALHVDANSESDVLKIKRVEDSASGMEILPIDQNEKVLPGMLAPVVVGVNPVNWYLLGNYLCFTPSPAQARNVKYWYTPMLADLTLDADRSQIPRLLHDMIAVRAAIDNFIKDEADARPLQSLWDGYMVLLRRVVSSRQVQAPRHVRRVGA